MAFYSFFAMLLAIYGLLNNLKITPKIINLIILWVILALSSFQFFYEALLILSSPISYLKTIKRSFIKFCLASDFEDWDDYRRVKGDPIFCNIAFSTPTVLKPYAYVVLYSGIPIGVKFSALKSKDGFVIEKVGLDSNIISFLNKFSISEDDELIVVENAFPFLKTSSILQNNVSYRRVFKIGDINLKVSYCKGNFNMCYYIRNSGLENLNYKLGLKESLYVLHCLSFWEENPELGVFDDRVLKRRRGAKIAHCLNLREIIEFIQSGKAPKYVFNDDKEKIVVEDNPSKLNCDKIFEYSKNLSMERRFICLFGENLYKCLIQLILMYIPESTFEQKIDIINYSGSVRKIFFKKITGLGNWQNKRLSADISYLRGESGLSRLDGIDISIKPSRKCLALREFLKEEENKSLFALTHTGKRNTKETPESVKNAIINVQKKLKSGDMKKSEGQESMKYYKQWEFYFKSLNVPIRELSLKQLTASPPKGKPSVQEHKIILHKIGEVKDFKKKIKIPPLKTYKEELMESINNDLNVKFEIVKEDLNFKAKKDAIDLIKNSQYDKKSKLFMEHQVNNIKIPKLKICEDEGDDSLLIKCVLNINNVINSNRINMKSGLKNIPENTINKRDQKLLEYSSEVKLDSEESNNKKFKGKSEKKKKKEGGGKGKKSWDKKPKRAFFSKIKRARRCYVINKFSSRELNDMKYLVLESFTGIKYGHNKKINELIRSPNISKTELKLNSEVPFDDEIDKMVLETMKNIFFNNKVEIKEI